MSCIVVRVSLVIEIWSRSAAALCGSLDLFRMTPKDLKQVNYYSRIRNVIGRHSEDSRSATSAIARMAVRGNRYAMSSTVRYGSRTMASARSAVAGSIRQIRRPSFIRYLRLKSIWNIFLSNTC